MNHKQQSHITLFNLMLLITLFTASLGQLQRIQLSNNIAFYAHDVFAVLTLLVFLVENRINKQQTVTKIKKLITRQDWLLWFFAWSLFSLVVNQIFSGFSLIPWLYWLRLGVYLALSILMYLKTGLNRGFNSWLKLAFFITLGSLVVIGLSQYLLIPDLRFIGQRGWDVHYYRLTGSMLDPNFLGSLLVIFLMTWIHKIKTANWLQWTVGVVVIVTLALTYSRSSYLAFGTVAMVALILPMIVRSNKAQQLPTNLNTVLLIVLILSLPLLPNPGGLGVNLKRTETVESRMKTNISILDNLTIKSIVIGEGLFTRTINRQTRAEKIVHAHFPDNLIVFVFSATGLPGLFLFLKFCWETIKETVNEHAINFLILTAIFVHSMFNLTVLEPINLMFLLLTLNI